MKKIIDYLKGSYKLIVTIVGAIGICGLLFATLNNIATAEDVKKSEARTIEQVNAAMEKTNKSIEALNDKIQWQSDMQRYKNLNDLSMQLDFMIQDNPRNKKLIEQKKKIDVERDALLDKISRTPAK